MILLQRFITDRRGNMAVMLALFLMSITMVAGGALDVVAANTAKDRLSDALDAALLAGAGSLSTSDDLAKTTAGNYLSRNAAGANNLRYAFTVNDDVLSGEASATSPTVFLGLFGIQDVPIKVEAAATVGAGSGGMELAIVVDVSGSMTGSIPSLRASITDLLGTIYEDEDSLENTWISIIPFSGRVNVTNYGGSWFASGQIPATAAFSQVNEWGITSNAASRCRISAYTSSAPRLCASRRTGDNQWTNALPSDERFRMFGGAAEVCPVPRAQGLTQSRSTLQQITNNLCAGQGTSTQEGMAWGWRAVSPRWKGLWGDPDLPLDYEDSPGKFVIIMTDGANHPGQSGDTISASQADAELLQTCDAMKREGIVIYAITYNMGGSLSSLYQRCTTRPEYEISAESFSDLTDAFMEIGRSIKGEGSLRLIK